MTPFPALDVLRVLVLGPLLLVLPGFLLLLPIAPRWGWLRRAVVGAGVTISGVALATWVLHAQLGVAYDARLVWATWGALALGGALAALALRRAWQPMPAVRLMRRHAILGAIVAFAGFTLYRPHLDYGLPFHIDEWLHLGAAESMLAQGTIHFIDPWFKLGHLSSNYEITYHLFLVDVKVLTGASWLGLFALLPALVGVLTVLAAYASAERDGYGLEAALFVALIPTSLRLLGPQFVVPVALGLFFIPIAFLLFTSLSAWRSVPILALFVLFVFFAHPQSDAALGILIGTYALVSARKSLWKSAVLLVLAAVPFVLGRILYPKLTDPEKILDVAATRLSVPDFLFFYGVIPAAFFLAGTYLVLLRPNAERVAWIVTSLAHLAIVALYLVAGIGQANVYDRAWMHGMLTMSMTAGYALWRLRARIATLRVPRAARATAFALVVAILVVVSTSAQASRERGYYRLADEQNQEDFAWIREHVDPTGARALVDPLKGRPFASLTGIPVYAVYPPIGLDARKGYYDNYFRAIGWLDDGGVNDTELQRANITLIYTPGTVLNQNFTEVHPHVWVRKGTNVTP